MMILASMQCHADADADADADVDGDREFQVQASQCASRHFFTASMAQPTTSPLLPQLLSSLLSTSSLSESSY